MSFEQTVNRQLNNHPGVKKLIKRSYQSVMYTVSPKVKSEGEIERVSPDKNGEYFFGYYDKSPEDITGRYVLCLRADNTYKNVAPASPADILLIDTSLPQDDPARVRVLGTSHSWNVQQGCMLQWLGPGFDREIIYNDFRNGAFCSVILDVFTGTERVLRLPVYSVSADGSFALTLDFSRLHTLRPGYGYSNLKDATKGKKIPAGYAVSRLDLSDNTVTPVLKYSDFAAFEPRKEMEGATHKVNHIMLRPDGRRFMVLHRWFDGKKKYTRLVTVNTDGTGMYNLSDDDMVSHCWWKNNSEIIAFENKNGEGAGYYLMKDESPEFTHLWPEMSADGHPSSSPDGRLTVTDTYPNRVRMAQIKVMSSDQTTVVASVFAPFRYDNDTRCDLHPRWSRDSKSIYFDSVFEGKRGLYRVNIGGIKFAEKSSVGLAVTPSEQKERIKIAYVMTSCKKLGPTQQTLNIIKNLNHDEFEPVLITINNEEPDSRLSEYLPYVTAHYFVPTGKKNVILGKVEELSKKLDEINPDIIHTVGVFPDYAVCFIGKYKQIHTLRNFIYDDYPAKFGKFRGNILAKLQLRAMKGSDRTIACSESLSKIYSQRLNMQFDFIRNGVDVDRYTMPTPEEKMLMRDRLSLPRDAFIFVYTGQFIERKNIPFMLDNYLKKFKDDPKAYLLMLGGGQLFDSIYRQYKDVPRVDFRGNVTNVNDFLKACDVYVSASKSEGLPNGVLEAMATGVPVVLSDIEQHKEIFEVDGGIGRLFALDSGDDLIKQLSAVYTSDTAAMGLKAYEVAHKSFNAKLMSEQYQQVYKETVRAENGEVTD